MDIRICSVCGHKNPKDNMYCEKCGNRLFGVFMNILHFLFK